MTRRDRIRSAFTGGSVKTGPSYAEKYRKIGYDRLGEVEEEVKITHKDI